jgi:hypothetical protein
MAVFRHRRRNRYSPNDKAVNFVLLRQTLAISEAGKTGETIAIDDV